MPTCLFLQGPGRERNNIPRPSQLGRKSEGHQCGRHHLGMLCDKGTHLLSFPVPGKWVGQVFLFCERMQARASNVKLPSGPFTMLLRFVFLKPTSTNQPVIMCPKLVIVFCGPLRTLGSVTLVSQQLDVSLCCLLQELHWAAVCHERVEGGHSPLFAAL